MTGPPQPLTEDEPLRPFTPYGASKVGAGFLALQAFLGTGLETIRVRAFNHTGPGQPPRFVVPALAHRVAQTEARRAASTPWPSATSTRSARSTTCATSCVPIACSWSSALPATSTTSAAASASPCARSRSGCSRRPPVRSSSGSTPRSPARPTCPCWSAIRRSSSPRPVGNPATRSTTPSPTCSPPPAPPWPQSPAALPARFGRAQRPSSQTSHAAQA